LAKNRELTAGAVALAVFCSLLLEVNTTRQAEAQREFVSNDEMRSAPPVEGADRKSGRMKMRQISIVMPNLNGQANIRESIDCFISQKYERKRLFIIDKLSNDDSHEIISDYCSKYNNIMWIREKDSGISNAINIGLEYVESEDIFGYMGSDDFLIDGALNVVGESFERLRRAQSLYFMAYVYDAASQMHLYTPKPTMTKRVLRKYGTIAGMQNFYTLGSIAKKVKMREDLSYAMDLDFYFRMIDKVGPTIAFVPIVTTINTYSNSTTSMNEKLSSREMIRVIVEHTGWSAGTIYKYMKTYM
jgi:hypothetical protein